MNLDQIPEKMAPTLDKLMAPVMPKSVAATAAPPPPAPAPTPAPAPVKKVAAAPATPPPAAEAPDAPPPPNYLWPMVTTGAGLVLAIGGGAIVANIYGDIQTIENATNTLTANDDLSAVNWQNIEDAQARLDTAGTIFDMGTTMAVTGLLITAGGMTWGILEKNRSETPAAE